MGQKIKEEELHEVNGNGILNHVSNFSKSSSQSETKEKKCVERNSLLTEMYHLDHMYSINKLVMVFLSAFICKEVVLHFLGIQKFDFALDLIIWNFGGLKTAFLLWMAMLSSSISFYYGFHFWAWERRKLLKQGEKPAIIKKWDYNCLFFVILYMITFLMVPCVLLMQKNLPVVTSMIILCEQIRFMMKKYAYCRVSIPIIMKNCEDDELKNCLPEVSAFIYFLFATTLIYRIRYPRKSHVNWKQVIWSFIHFAAMVSCLAIIYKRCIMPHYLNFSEDKLSWKILMADVISTIIPGLIMQMACFHLLLHSWMNAVAEIIKFPDRMFYKDWWNSSNYSIFFRTWNVIVGDWLHEYIYKDVAFLTAVKDKKTGMYKSIRVIPRMTVFIISAFFHEYIIAVSLKFLYPIQFILFAGVGGLLTSVARTEGDMFNVMMIFSLGFGDAIMFALYCNEWYARKSCSMQMDPFWDFVIPRSWYC